MTWQPNTTVTIDGVSYNSQTVARLSLTAGRTNVDEQPRAGYGTITLIQTDDQHINIDLGARLQVDIDNSTGNPTSIFRGLITDVNRSLTKHGAYGQVVQISIQVVGVLAWLARFSTTTAYSKKYDGQRIADILADVFAQSWSEVNATLKWNAVTPTLNWVHYDSSGFVGNIEQPGDYEMVAYAGDAVAADGYAAQVANSALGVLYETGDGFINYYSATARADEVATNGFTSIPSGYLSTAISSSSSTSDLANIWTVTDGTGTIKTAQDSASIDAYGFFAGSKTTLLHNATDAQQQADLLAATRAWPRENLAAVRIPLHNPDLPSATLDKLLAIYCGLPLEFPDLPSAIREYPFQGFAEGYTWNINLNTAELVITLSDYGLTQIQQNWTQVNAAETWNTLSLTLKWEDARSVA